MSNRIYLGAKLSLLPETIGDTRDGSEKTQKPMIGTVVYIHPKGRYFIAEFTVRDKKLREAFTLPLIDRGTKK